MTKRQAVLHTKWSYMNGDFAAWEPESRLQGEVQDQFDRQLAAYREHSDLIVEHANLEESIRTGGYAHRTILELVQNAADALSRTGQHDNPGSGRIEIVLDQESQTLYCANEGEPFTDGGLRSITMAYLSKKRGDEIGRFGLGFKSVLAVSEAPQVLSHSVAFEFNSGFANEKMREISPAAKRFPILRTATVLDARDEFKKDPVLATLAIWATTIVKLPGLRGIPQLLKDLKGFRSELLLFARGINEVRIRILGQDLWEASHTARDLGGGRLMLQSPNRDRDEWIVEHRDHRPSQDARKQVGEAVSREVVTVSVAIPRKITNQRIGGFWSYFPLDENTTASALFNAPWSVNDDRTHLLPNDYNNEIARTVSEVFVDLLPRVRSDDDPAAHLEYMPSRGQELRSYGDKRLFFHIPGLASERALIPDAEGTLRKTEELRPLDFSVTIDKTIHKSWCESVNTGTDVPSWYCYRNPTRTNRLRDLFIAAAVTDPLTLERKNPRSLLESLPHRGLLTWLREWAEGDDPVSAANAFKMVCGHPQFKNNDRAKVIPTDDGMRSLRDKDTVFLISEDDPVIEGALFVDTAFLSQPGVERRLRDRGFRELGPEAVLTARLKQLSQDPTDGELSRLWDAALDVPPREATQILIKQTGSLRVPTLDGGWAPPSEVFDIGFPLGDELKSKSLDASRCIKDVAHKLGVIREPVRQWHLSAEPEREAYLSWVIDTINSAKGPGQRQTETVDLYPGSGPGPWSVLQFLDRAQAPLAARMRWTQELLKFRDEAWYCEDTDTQKTYRTISPLLWSVKKAGIVNTDMGFRSPEEVVSKRLLRYRGLLPLLEAPSHVDDALGLPRDLQDVPSSLFVDALASQAVPAGIRDQVLVEFILTACRIAYEGHRPQKIPARVQNSVEPCLPSSVYLATTDEQEVYLSSRQRPYLRVTDEMEQAMVDAVGCRRFEDSFAFSILVEGQQESERVTDIFPGLRNRPETIQVLNATVSRVRSLSKRVTTEDGVEDETMRWHLEGANLLATGQAGDRELLQFVSQAFELHLDNAELSKILQAGLDHQLEQSRNEAKAASTDEDRLDVYFGPDDLRESLPSGLWNALESQGLVDASTSVSELFLIVYGADSIKMLADLFRQQGFPDVPTEWAGGKATISWLRKMGFSSEYAGRRSEHQDDQFVVPGAINLSPLHDFQQKIGSQIREIVLDRDTEGRHKKAMVELPTGAGKTRVACDTVLGMFIDGSLRGPVLWIAQSIELCEQAIQTWSTVWRGLGDERPLALGRLWENNIVHEPDTDFSVVVATDAKLDVILNTPEYEWLRNATLVIIDEGHRAGSSERYTRILRWLGIAGHGFERPLVGLSATPFKGTSDDATQALAKRFGNRIIRAFEGRAYQELSKMGVLARVQHEVLTGVDVELGMGEIANVKKQRRISGDVLNRIGRDQARMSILVEHILRQDSSWPVLVFTPSVLSAQVLAATLRYRGERAAAVSGQTGRQERRDIINRFKSGELRILANCDLLIQGFDAPGVRALYIARPTFSPNAYIQMAGRGLRGPINGGKSHCLIVDMADNFGEINDYLGYRDYEPLWEEQVK